MKVWTMIRNDSEIPAVFATKEKAREYLFELLNKKEYTDLNCQLDLGMAMVYSLVKDKGTESENKICFTFRQQVVQE